MQVHIVKQQSYHAACKTTPATPGGLNIIFIHEDHKDNYYTVLTNYCSYNLSQAGYIDWLFRLVCELNPYKK